jgi:beta-alanine degradation protein BauB
MAYKNAAQPSFSTLEMEAIVTANWRGGRREELAKARNNPAAGSKLVSVSGRVRLWHIELKPGERPPFHCHMLDYFWTATSAGLARTRLTDGSHADARCDIADTEHMRIKRGDAIVHGLQNAGDTVPSFVTVEFLHSENPPLPPGGKIGV